MRSAKLSMKDLEKILAATLSGMSVEEFGVEVKKWIATAKHPRYDRLYTELTYQPMQEVLAREIRVFVWLLILPVRFW